MNDIDFDKIIITGFAGYTGYDRKNLMSYFVSEFKEGERSHFFDPQFFFDSCLVTMKKYDLFITPSY